MALPTHVTPKRRRSAWWSNNPASPAWRSVNCLLQLLRTTFDNSLANDDHAHRLGYLVPAYVVDAALAGRDHGGHSPTISWPCAIAEFDRLTPADKRSCRN